jgi:O-antigen/teichoic acid export membrane protein
MPTSITQSLAIFALCPYLITNVFPTFTDAIPLVSVMSLSVIPSTVAAILTASFLGNGKSKQVFTADVIYLASLLICLSTLGLTVGILGLAFAVITAKTIQATYMLTQRDKPKKTSPKHTPPENANYTAANRAGQLAPLFAT